MEHVKVLRPVLVAAVIALGSLVPAVTAGAAEPAAVHACGREFIGGAMYWNGCSYAVDRVQVVLTSGRTTTVCVDFGQKRYLGAINRIFRAERVGSCL